MQRPNQKYITEVKLSTKLIEKVDKILVLLTCGVIAGSFFLAAIIISSTSLNK